MDNRDRRDIVFAAGCLWLMISFAWRTEPFAIPMFYAGLIFVVMGLVGER